jgi:hypothetical protein
MRPDVAIRTGQQTRHWHGYGEPPEDDRWYQKLNPDTDAGKEHRWKWHTAPEGKMTDEKREARERGEEPANTEEVHLHDDLAKYVFPPDPMRKTKPRVHTYDPSYPLPKNPPKRGKYSNHMEMERVERAALRLEVVDAQLSMP